MAKVSRHPQHSASADHLLNEREQIILRSIVESFVHTADPVGSRFLARRFMIGLSPASIRNTMSDLEDLGYLGQPHTSAGRIPTELGYRAFVDELMDPPDLPAGEKQAVRTEVVRLSLQTDELLRESSRLLGRLSNLLGVALSPKLSTGVLQRLDIVSLSSSRVMFIISVRSGLVKTIVLEVESEMRREELDCVVTVLNERLAGLTLEEIRQTFATRVMDIPEDRSGIVRLIMNEASTLFSELPESRRVSYAGAQNIVSQPEFQEPAELRQVMEMLEHEHMVINLLEQRKGDNQPDQPGTMVTIGRENPDEKAGRFSIVTARYKIGDSTGTIGVIGPMRMDYSRVIALVDHMASVLSGSAEDGSRRES